MFKSNELNKLENYLFRRNGKYVVIGISISIIHFVYLLFFHRISNLSMIVYNILSIAGYIYFSLEAYKGNHIKNFLMFIALEIPLSASLSTIYVGWDYRFMLIVTASINIIYYFVMFIDDFKHKILTPTVLSIFYLLLYVFVRVYTNSHDALQSVIRKNDLFVTFFIYFNTIISFICIIFFNVLSAIEHAYVKNKFVTENNKLDTFATFDPLTNLLNRRSMDGKLKNYLDKYYYDDDSFSVIMCDIDKFKSVNDTYGHDTGDYVLKEVANILKDTVRDEDSVGRWGGEEFLILVNSNKSNATILAERIRAKIEAHKYIYKNVTLNITITLGVSSFRANTNIETLIKSADQKLYRGKENGRNQVVS